MIDIYNFSIINKASLFQTYYASVRASTLDGSMIVSSDGVTILPVDTLLGGVQILDALPCSIGM